VIRITFNLNLLIGDHTYAEWCTAWGESASTPAWETRYTSGNDFDSGSKSTIISKL